MQGEIKQNLPFIKRLNKLRLLCGWTWEETARAVGLSRTMLHFIRTGKHGVTDKVLYRLEYAETHAGLKPENPIVEHAVFFKTDPSLIKGFGRRLRWVRKQSGLTAEEFAKRCGVAQEYIANLEKGTKLDPDKDFLERLNSNFKINIGWLISAEGTASGELIQKHTEERISFPALQRLNQEELEAALSHFNSEARKQKKPYLKELYMEFAGRIFTEIRGRISDQFPWKRGKIDWRTE